jgi:hypothetical protein
MEFLGKGLIFVKTEIITRVDKGDLNFVHVHNPLTFETDKFFVANESLALVKSLVGGTKVDTILVTNQNFMSLKVSKSI